mmetsp:Transcript_44056/g.103761  ORF Transcript_44056/g.103761 Transcript_44056/m.103761 type:complete len:96 (-) Transcript_44056:72-359(-)
MERFARTGCRMLADAGLNIPLDGRMTPDEIGTPLSKRGVTGPRFTPPTPEAGPTLGAWTSLSVDRVLGLSGCEPPSTANALPGRGRAEGPMRSVL